ncbi:hypothetical protein ID866_8765 [Astraeus odoratus]|nr:hypothetical protein ID866_8765 [Astraeus odoratus]
MSLEELLNPTVEPCAMIEASDEEIYHAVMEVQHGNGEAEDDLVDPPPTCHEALEATLLIEKYVEDMDEPLATILEMDLGLFQCLLCSAEFKSVVPMHMTDYFTLQPN